MSQEIIKTARENMQKTIDNYSKEISLIKTGRANAAILDGIKIEYYGFPTPLKEVSQVSVPEPRTIMIKPFEKESLPLIEKAIASSNLGLYPNNDGNVIRLNIPSLTEERRKEFVKILGKTSEEAKVAVRNIRRRVNDALKQDKTVSEDQIKREEKDIQKVTDDFTKKIEELQKIKEKEIMTI